MPNSTEVQTFPSLNNFQLLMNVNSRYIRCSQEFFNLMAFYVHWNMLIIHLSPSLVHIPYWKKKCEKFVIWIYASLCSYVCSPLQKKKKTAQKKKRYYFSAYPYKFKMTKPKKYKTIYKSYFYTIKIAQADNFYMCHPKWHNQTPSIFDLYQFIIRYHRSWQILSKNMSN